MRCQLAEIGKSFCKVNETTQKSPPECMPIPFPSHSCMNSVNSLILNASNLVLLLSHVFVSLPRPPASSRYNLFYFLIAIFQARESLFPETYTHSYLQCMYVVLSTFRARWEVWDQKDNSTRLGSKPSPLSSQGSGGFFET